MTTGLNTQSLFQSLQTELNQLDEERLAARKAKLKVSLIWLPLLFIAIGVSLWSTSMDDSYVTFYVVGFGALVLFVVWSVKVGKIKKAFAKSFKVKLIDKIIKKIDPGFTYEPDSTYHGYKSTEGKYAYMKKINLMPSFHEFWMEDVIKGAVRENKFEFSEVKMDHGSGRNRQTVFTGVVITVYLNNPLPSPIYILPDSANKLRDSLWKMLNLTSKRGEIVVLNHEGFEKLFKVYAEDPMLPQSLLKMNVLEKLVSIHGKISAINPVHDSIRMVFIDNTITIAVKLKTNLFEPRLDKPINDLAYFESNVQYLVLFLGLIEDLNLSR